MHDPRRRRPNPITTWLACLAIVLNALVPPFAQAFTADSDRADVVAAAVCTFDGATASSPATAVGSDRDAPHAPSLPAAVHCPFCVSSVAAPMGPPSARPAGWLTATSAEAPCGISCDAVRPGFALSPAHAPRAPPTA